MDNKKYDKNSTPTIGAIIVNSDTNEVETKPVTDKYFDDAKSIIQEKIIPNKINDLHAEINAITKNTEGLVLKDSVADFLRGTPYEAVKGFTPKPMCTHEQFEATDKIEFDATATDEAMQKILKIRSQTTDKTKSENKNK